MMQKHKKCIFSPFLAYIETKGSLNNYKGQIVPNFDLNPLEWTKIDVVIKWLQSIASQNYLILISIDTKYVNQFVLCMH